MNRKKQPRWCTVTNVVVGSAGSGALCWLWMCALVWVAPLPPPSKARTASAPLSPSDRASASNATVAVQSMTDAAKSNAESPQSDAARAASAIVEVRQSPEDTLEQKFKKSKKNLLAGAGKSSQGAASPSAPSPPPPPPPRSHGLSLAKSDVSCGGHHARECSGCLQGHDSGWCHGDCEWNENACQAKAQGAVHPMIAELIKEYPFQPVRSENGEMLNLVLVRSPFRSNRHRELYDKYKDEIVFLGLSSFEDFPLPPDNPFSSKFPFNYYAGLFPGFLHMMREPEKFFASDVKLLLMSQSDFALPPTGGQAPKKEYDWVFSGTDQDVDQDCVGWSSFAKNWSFVKESLEVMCGEFKLKGVLVATKDKQGKRKCTIPKNCDGLVEQTTFLDQGKFYDYVKKSRFAFIPQVHDASPRAAAQALGLNTPVLMNWYIRGGWKYVNEETGEFFHDMTDFRTSLERILRRVKEKAYSPSKYMNSNYGDERSGKKLKKFVQENFGDRVKLPERVRLLLPSGA